MDKNAIKKYAVWARRELIDRVSTKAKEFGITEEEIVPASADSIKGHLLTKAQKAQRTALIEQINKNGYKQVIEGVAYTWFNRFSALRFMEVNGYLPTHIRVFTDEENNFKPQILAEAIHLELDGLHMDKVYELKQENKTEELFKYLIITQCNALGAILPGMFQKIEDYTELLFPDNLLREGSVIQQMIEIIPEEDWTEQVQIIGWLYQYYNTEPKDKVFADLKNNIKITKESIPAATQLFTPDWIVRYMVENSLGRIWVEGHPNDELKSTWKYYIDEADQESKVKAQLELIRSEYANIKPEEIKVIDPCMGSGHILAYMFDVLIQIYEAYGYSTRDAVKSIVENNIYGLDIDDRAAQLASFSVMMKARQYDKRFFSRKDENGELDVPQPCVFEIVESNSINQFTIDYFSNGDNEIKTELLKLITQLHDAKEYGSILNIVPINYSLLYQRIAEIVDDISLNRQYVLDDILPLIRVAEVLSKKYHCVVTNPPYMGANNMAAKMSEFIRKYYPASKSDLSTVFMEKTMSLTQQNGFTAMINIPVWMFLSSYEDLRLEIIKHKQFVSLLHLGRGVFGADFGTTSFVIRNCYIAQYSGIFRKLYARQGSVDDNEKKIELFKSRYGTYIKKQDKFLTVPGSCVAYSASEELLSAFVNGKRFDSFSEPKQGMATADNNRFLRLWHEVSMPKIAFGCGSHEEAAESRLKWFPYNKGGGFKKWYGNNEYVINWENDGFELINFPKSVIRSPQFYFKECLSWCKITISGFSMRYIPQGFLFDVAGCSLFIDSSKMYYALGFANSIVNSTILSIISPTVNYEVGHIASLPLLTSNNEQIISKLVKQCIDISKEDWNSFEYSWDFYKHPLVALKGNYEEAEVLLYSDDLVEGITPVEVANINSPIAQAYYAWERICDDRFLKLKANEEEINKNFIEIYGLENELEPAVDTNYLTICKAELSRDIRSFISYAVGCMFGRYSLDEDGLILAGEDFGTKFTYATVPLTGTGITGSPSSFTYTQGDCYLKKKDGSLQKCSFAPDKDNILPICDDEYFEDDIVGKFVRFVATVYGEETLEENLRFIAEALGGKGAPREVIRTYFLNDFYNDHLKIYQKRPIYWQFDSGKKNGFKCLIYMHRYQPDTIARIRTDYVHEQQARYRTAIAGVEQRIANASTAERVRLNKQLVKLKDQEAEIHAFEEKIHHLADQMIRIDLDDGVKHNYEIFKDVLTKIK